LNKRNLLGKNKRERFKLNLTATMLHITVLVIAILTSFFQIVYVIAGYDSDYANEWETRLGTVDIILEAFISLIVCYVCWFLTHEPTKKENKQDVSESVHLIPDETTEDHDLESSDSFRAKMNRDSRMLYEDVPETPPTLKDRNASQATMGFMRADSVFY
jgi:heme/copper-type cytochrome/quinol oxidase subunit 2